MKTAAHKKALRKIETALKAARWDVARLAKNPAENLYVLAQAATRATLLDQLLELATEEFAEPELETADVRELTGVAQATLEHLRESFDDDMRTVIDDLLD